MLTCLVTLSHQSINRAPATPDCLCALIRSSAFLLATRLSRAHSARGHSLAPSGVEGPLSLSFATLPRFLPITPLLATLPKTHGLKSRICHTYKNWRGWGG